MSEAKDLNEFFAKQGSKKKNKKQATAATKAKSSAATAAAVEQPKEERVEEKKEEVKQAAAQPEAQPPTQDYADSSDDESNQIIIDKKKVVDIKDIEASKKKKQGDEADGAAGWGLGTALRSKADDSAAASQSVASAAKGPSTGGGRIQFGKGPPTFTRKNKGIMGNEDFPDLDQAAGDNPDAPQKSKADSAMIFTIGAATRGCKHENGAPAEEAKKPSKPIFTGKARLVANDTKADDVQNSRMNYDFSRMRMSAATTGKKPEGAARGEGAREDGGDQERRGNRDNNAKAGGFSDDDEDFEVVREKKKTGFNRPRNDFGDSGFASGGGKPNFFRSGGGDGPKRN